MNAIAPIPSTQAQRHERRPQKCERLADLGMELAEAAQREALRELQPPPVRFPVPPGQYMPPLPPHIRDTTCAELFATFSRTVRQAILLEARLDSGLYDRPPPVRTTPSATTARPAPSRPREPGDGTYLDHEALEDDLAADANRAPDDILLEISETLGQAIEPLPPAITQARPITRTATPAQNPEPARPGRMLAPEKRPPPKPG